MRIVGLSFTAVLHGVIQARGWLVINRLIWLELPVVRRVDIVELPTIEIEQINSRS